MPEDWDGTTRDRDEVLYEISVKEDQMLYEEFVQKLNFNKKKVSYLTYCYYFFLMHQKRCILMRSLEKIVDHF